MPDDETLLPDERGLGRREEDEDPLAEVLRRLERSTRGEAADLVDEPEGAGIDAGLERARAAELCRRMRDPGDPEEWKGVLAGLDAEPKRPASWAVCERLCHESAAAADDDPRRAGELAGLALEVASGEPEGKGRGVNSQEYAWMHAGNALRARGLLQEAEDAFRRSQSLYMSSAITGSNLLDHGRIYGFEAALLRDQGRVAEALSRVDFGVRMVDAAEQAALLLEKGRLLRQVGKAEKGVESLYEARKVAARLDEPRLRVRAALELGSLLCDLGRHREAADLPGSVRREAARFPVEEARLVVLGGRIAVGLGQAAEAEAALGEARGLLQPRTAADVLLLSLELAALYARLGQAEKLRALTEETARLPESATLTREAAASLKLFLRLAAAGKLTAERAAQFARELTSVASRA